MSHEGIDQAKPPMFMEVEASSILVHRESYIFLAVLNVWLVYSRQLKKLSWETNWQSRHKREIFVCPSHWQTMQLIWIQLFSVP
jgi:hypothetical protein